MSFKSKHINRWAFAFLLALPVFYLYLVHFLHHDPDHYPTGFIQWEHIMYLFSAKEYADGHAHVLYAWPMLNAFPNGAVFFQPQIFMLGYLWKGLSVSPAVILLAFDFIFALLTLRMVIALFDLLIPNYQHQQLLIVLFCWGGGILSALGICIHFLLFKGEFKQLSDHIFFLDPAQGSWCLNFGRTLIYPLEAYYHFLFVTGIWLVLKKRFATAFILMLLLILSHPYTSIELISTVLVWITAEVFYFKNKSHYGKFS